MEDIMVFFLIVLIISPFSYYINMATAHGCNDKILRYIILSMTVQHKCKYHHKI